LVKFEVWVIDRYADQFEERLLESREINYMILEAERYDKKPNGSET
jgi:hypothetical protein